MIPDFQISRLSAKSLEIGFSLVFPGNIKERNESQSPIKRKFSSIRNMEHDYVCATATVTSHHQVGMVDTGEDEEDGHQIRFLIY